MNEPVLIFQKVLRTWPLQQSVQGYVSPQSFPGEPEWVLGPSGENRGRETVAAGRLVQGVLNVLSPSYSGFQP